MKSDNVRQQQFPPWSLEFSPIQNIYHGTIVLNAECISQLFVKITKYLRQTNFVRKRFIQLTVLEVQGPNSIAQVQQGAALGCIAVMVQIARARVHIGVRAERKRGARLAPFITTLSQELPLKIRTSCKAPLPKDSIVSLQHHPGDQTANI